MADNSLIPVAVGNETFANKDIGGVKFPKNIQYDSAGAEVVPATSAAQATQLTQQTAINTVLGTTAGAAVTTNATGTIQQYLRGIVSLLVSGITVVSHAVTNAGTFAVQNTAATPAGTNNIGDVDVLTLPALPAGSNAIGKLAANVGVNIGEVSVAASQLAPARTTAGAMSDTFQLVDTPTDGTNATRLGGLTETAPASDTASSGLNGRLQRIAQRITSLIGSTLITGGDIAHDAADSGSPVKGGHKATTSLAGLPLVANADRSDSFSGVDGVQIVRPHCNLEDIVSGILANTDGASTAVIAAQGAGIKVYVTTVIIANSSATAVTVDLRDGAAGSVKATFPVPANTSGVVCNLPVPLGFTANTAVCMDGSAAASTVTCTLIGFKSKV